MGGSSRYDRRIDVDAEHLAEARDFRELAAALRDQHDGTIPDRQLAWQVAGVLSAAAGELANGRALPLELRRSVRGVAGALRDALGA
ncbi:hypothetical protein [Pseudonocardia sp. WMMC193]|uniref:hypothetical protein n=1 Tax=Pseudonocardia sp. WMMC193 TaxID=2911965 RepID=UPI001F26D454|nr:hypothetical protein [Pseudonocardia sp. WMMC193]MCF7547343.1 hypothetical protein [Pseudonocardia sp. WMMC193]